MNQIGIYNLPRCAAHPNDKVINLFTKLKRKAKQIEPQPQSSSNPAPGQPVRDIEPNMNELGELAMNSYRLRSDVIKTEGGHRVA